MPVPAMIVNQVWPPSGEYSIQVESMVVPPYAVAVQVIDIGLVVYVLPPTGEVKVTSG
jgi:hypothetical protein